MMSAFVMFTYYVYISIEVRCCRWNKHQWHRNQLATTVRSSFAQDMSRYNSVNCISFCIGLFLHRSTSIDIPVTLDVVYHTHD